MATKIKLDATRFNESLRGLMQFSRRDTGTVLKEQIRGFATTVIDLTPPARGGRRGTAAKKAGEKSVEGDIRKSFIPVHPNRADISLHQMEPEVRRLRSGGSKKVRRGSATRRASRGDITRLVKSRKRRVGALAGAWVTAARGLGAVRAPAWVKRHSGESPGRTKIRIGLNKAIADIFNEVEYASEMHGIGRRVQIALNAQARKMDRRVNHFLMKRAKKAGFKTT